MADGVASLLGPRPLSRRRVQERIAVAVAAIDRTAPPPVDPIELAIRMERFSPRELWLVAAVVLQRLPVPAEVRRLRRAFELDGLDGVVRRFGARSVIVGAAAPTIVSDRAVLDVTGLFDTSVAGREIGRRLVAGWVADGGLAVTWTRDGRALRSLDPSERSELRLVDDGASYASVIPFRTHYLVLGSVESPRSAERVIALGSYSENGTGSIGYGLAPLLRPGPPAEREGDRRFSWHLAAQRSLDRLAVVGEVEHEYRGWVQMLSAVGITGPRIEGFAYPEGGSSAAADEWNTFARLLEAHFGLSLGR